MSSRVHAKFIWVPKEQGGRESLPPVSFVTPARFEKYKDLRPDNAWWSLRFDFSDTPEDFSVAEISFLVEEGPQELLQPGSKFDIFDGSRLVASGEVID